MANTDHSTAIRKAVRFYWQSKTKALKKNQSGKNPDQGSRGGATAGKNFDGFAEMFAKLAKKHGSKKLEIHQSKSNVVLPGHFRPSKQWDILFTLNGKLIAVLEFKALGGGSNGDSYTKNTNNRCEEALGSGLDLSVAQREGLFGAGASPFVGYCILVEDEDKSRCPTKRGNPSKHFAADPAFKTASYQQRMQILCERMVQERIYTAAAVVASPPNAAKSGKFSDRSVNTSLNKLIAKFVAHIEVEAG